MNNYRDLARDAIGATAIHSPTAYSWFGSRSRHVSQSVRRAMTPKTARNYLLFALQSQLYSDFYCKGVAQSATQRNTGNWATSRTQFVEALAAANSGDGYWVAGWQIRANNGREVVANKERLSLRMRLEDCQAMAGDALAPGRPASVRFTKELPALSPGFYIALGNEELEQEGVQGLIRWYWNFVAAGAVPFLRRTTLMLNQEQVPYRLKVLNDPANYTRCDAVVLYVRKTHQDAVSKILADIYPDMAPDLKPGTPVFTKRLAAGVGLAEDPGAGESFGLHRSSLLAEGMICAHEQGYTSIEQRLKTVEDHFTKEGISLDEPFLNPGSKDEYRFPVHLSRRTHERDVPLEGCDDNAFLQTATQIGNRLSKDAVWYQGHCNWLSSEPEVHAFGKGVPSIVCKSMGPELYSGTSGVALFLAELHAATGDIAARETALGAIRHALSNCDAVPPPMRLGLYTGWTGIAFSAARVGVLLSEEELLERALGMVRRADGENQKEKEFDLLSGMAGAIAALIILRDTLGDTSLLDLSVQLGDELLRGAVETRHGCSWKSINFPNQPNLTGFSHGAAGVAYALLELFQVTGDFRYRHAAERAFAYERHWYNEDAGNWPDLRAEPRSSRYRRSPPNFATAWCHGAPGIALSRLRAYQLVKNELYRAEALVALHATQEAVMTGLRGHSGIYSLCHGLAGNADILLHVSALSEQEQRKARSLARQVAYAGVGRYSQRGREWPCGPAGETPGLMLGLAGIGYFYLRLHDRAPPSILMLQRESFDVGSSPG